MELKITKYKLVNSLYIHSVSVECDLTKKLDGVLLLGLKNSNLYTAKKVIHIGYTTNTYKMMIFNTKF